MVSNLTSSSSNPPSGTCRAGNKCSFVHPNGISLPGLQVPEHGEQPEASGSTTSSRTVNNSQVAEDRKQAVTQPIASRVVPKPVPQAHAQDPREFQVGQIRRRFSPKETKQHNGNLLLRFDLRPSDPDFPFEMSALECSLAVPVAYPKANPTLKVGNRDIPRGFSVNIEVGFDGLVEEKPDATLLELVKYLDRNLETFLSAPKAETVKLVPNNTRDTRHLSNTPARLREPATTGPSKAEDGSSMQSSVSKPVEAATKLIVVFSTEQKSEAKKRRENEVRQLEARMGRLPLYKKFGDGIAYTLPVEPRKRAELPNSIQAVKTIRLFVPLLYPLQPCRIQLEGVDLSESKAVEKGFEMRASEQKDATLMGHVNYLAQNMHIFAKTSLEDKPLPVLTSVSPPEQVSFPAEKGKGVERHQDTERSHIQYIARPPEWTILSREELSGSDSDGYDSYDSGDDVDTDAEGEEGRESRVEVKAEQENISNQPTHNQERGTAISFPFVELYGIELLEIVLLNLTVKCERCKDVIEMRGLKDGTTKTESCKKCASPLNAGFRRDLIHAHAVRAGFLDLEGCIIMDMLPSSFIPTCSQCSTPYPSPGIVSVQGETTTNVCRECHQKFTFSIPQVKFLRISSTDRLPPAAGPRKRKEVLGLIPGTELPKRGRCRHYTKSYRWFRFSCCQKVYACDKCHDEGEEHPNEWANRMICGWCSREGNYRPEDCSVCHGVLVGKRGGGFWEGGKGTRDKVKMSRKDKRKYRRIGGAKK